MSTTQVTFDSVSLPVNNFIKLTQGGTGGGEAFVSKATGALTSVTFQLARSADASGQIAADLAFGGVSAGALIGQSVPPIAGSNIIDLSTIPTIDTAPQGAPVTFNFPSMPVLEAGIVYAIVVQIGPFSGTALWVFGGNVATADPTNNSVAESGFFVWTANTIFDVNILAVGIQIPLATLTVITDDGAGFPIYPVTVTLTNTGLNVSLSQTSKCPNPAVVFQGVPAGNGYVLTETFTDSTGSTFKITSKPFGIFNNLCITNVPFPGPPCISLADFFLAPQPPNGTVDFLKWEARPSDHHVSLSSGEQETIIGVVRNNSSMRLYATMNYAIVLPDGTSEHFSGVTIFVRDPNLNCDYVILDPGQEMQFSFSFTPPQIGTYSASLAVSYGTVTAPRSSSSSKTIKFDVVA